MMQVIKKRKFVVGKKERKKIPHNTIERELKENKRAILHNVF